jgi:hypothetical protein
MQNLLGVISPIVLEKKSDIITNKKTNNDIIALFLNIIDIATYMRRIGNKAIKKNIIVFIINNTSSLEIFT